MMNDVFVGLCILCHVALLPLCFTGEDGNDSWIVRPAWHQLCLVSIARGLLAAALMMCP